ncbi:LCP family protein [Patescibacteria group bacterium]|nr:LCP family protein [Patescibacteria group bacterium]
MPENRINLINDIYSPEDISQKIEQPNKNKKFRIIFHLLIFISAIGIFFFTTNIVFSSNNSLITNMGKMSFWKGVSKLVIGKEEILKGEISDRINILILGMGGANHEGAYLTDTIILASLKPSTNQIALLSIPRDLYVPIPDYGWKKINAANAFGMMESDKQGGELSKKVVENILGLKVHYWIRTDFKIFRDIIDELGGIEIEVAKSFTDYQFPGYNFTFRTVSFAKGKQIMSGQKALEFARSRHGNNEEDSDFARAIRQQKILFAIKEKIKQENLFSKPNKIWSFYNILEKNISTNLDIMQGIKLAKIASSINKNNIITRVIKNGDNGLLKSEININGAYILTTKEKGFKQLSNLAKDIFKQEIPEKQIVFGQKPSKNSLITDSSMPTNLEEPINKKTKIIILNGTLVNNLAFKASEKIDEKNFEILKIGNAPTRNYKETIIYKTSDNLASAGTLAKIFNGDVIENKRPTNLEIISINNNADFLIILGQNSND